LGKLAEYVSTDISKFKKAVLENKVEEIYVLGERFIDARDKLKTYEKLAAIGQTSAMLAHDIRRPFLNVKLILNMLDTYKNNPVALEAAKKEVKKSICNVESMLSDIMDFSREVKLETKPFPLVPLIGSSIKQSIQSYHDANIKFDYNFAHTKQPLVDVVRMERAFCNIIGNAIDAITEFSKANGGTISIFSKDVLSNNGTVLEIIIGNDGPSFEDEDLASMFELFFTKGKKGGTGIGLASTQKIVSLHNGSVKARNRLNKNGDIDGVEFVILIPASGEIEKIN
jgi:signal transduction histidine kinase